jgi:carbon monoxide dehydrogenase subunit G
MELESRFTVPFPRGIVWRAFKDVETLVNCMPGASLRSPPTKTENGLDLDLGFAVKLGPISATFAGRGSVVYADQTYRGTLSGSGSDQRTNSRVKGTGDFVLSEISDGAGTDVGVKIDYALTGALAQFSRGGIVKEIANQLTAQFARNLAKRLSEASAAAAPAAGQTEETRPPAPAAPEAQPLEMGGLFFRALGQWLKDLLGLSKREKPAAGAQSALEVNLPDIVAEVTEAFRRYEKALVTNDVPVLDALFWKSSSAIRYGVAESLYGYDEIAAFRAGRPPVNLARTLSRTVVTTFGRDFATTNTEFARDGLARPGRQSQTWVRTADGWRIVAAHVSLPQSSS